MEMDVLKCESSVAIRIFIYLLHKAKGTYTYTQRNIIAVPSAEKHYI